MKSSREGDGVMGESVWIIWGDYMDYMGECDVPFAVWVRNNATGMLDMIEVVQNPPRGDDNATV